MNMQFGKYRGKSLEWILENDPQYANWVAKESNSRTRSKRQMQSLIDSKAKENSSSLHRIESEFLDADGNEII